jgi:hypothetical protein
MDNIALGHPLDRWHYQCKTSYKRKSGQEGNEEIYIQTYQAMGFGYYMVAVVWVCKFSFVRRTRHFILHLRGDIDWFYSASLAITVTTWAFGPGLSDRILVYSGAQCLQSSLSSDTLKDHAQSSNPNAAILEPSHCISPSWQAVEDAGGAQEEVGIPLPTAAEPMSTVVSSGSSSGSTKHVKASEVSKTKRAYWVGGHDLSGHAFLLSMSSLFLLSEIAPTLSGTYLSSSSGTSVAKRVEQASKQRRYAALAIVALISLWYWMLLMTSLYFHTPQEKFTGLLAGVIGWWVSFTIAA